MKFPELLSGQLIRRYKRFLADVRLDPEEEASSPTGRGVTAEIAESSAATSADSRKGVDVGKAARTDVVVAHCANPGSMKSVVEPPPKEVWLSRARPGRKLAYTWEVAVLSDGTRVYVNPLGANQVVARALERGVIEELAGYDIIQPEIRYGTSSRIDFLLTGRPGRAYVEVKNVTLGLGEGRAAFPDAVTQRGTKHLEELLEVTRAGHRGVLLFCVARTDALSVEPAWEIDATYAATLERVAEQGVEVLAYGGDISKEGFSLSRRIPVVLRR